MKKKTNNIVTLPLYKMYSIKLFSKFPRRNYLFTAVPNAKKKKKKTVVLYSLAKKKQKIIIISRTIAENRLRYNVDVILSDIIRDYNSEEGGGHRVHILY